MDNDLQRCYQRNLGIGAVSIFILAFAFALWVNSLEAPSADVTVYHRHSVITAYPFANTFRIVRAGKTEGNPKGKLVISQSGVGLLELGNDRRSSTFKRSGDAMGSYLKTSALSAFESRLMYALKTGMELKRDLIVLPLRLDWTYSLERPDTVEVYGYILADTNGATFKIDSIIPDDELVTRMVKRTFVRMKVFVSRPRIIPYASLFVKGEDVREIRYR